MTGKTHQLLGLSASLGIYLSMSSSVYSPATFVSVIVASHFGSLWPDLDSAAADIWDSLPIINSTKKVISPNLGHRRFTHSIIGFLFFNWLFYEFLSLFPSYWGIDTAWVFYAFLIGYIAHIIADSLTEQGVPLLFPYKGQWGFPPKPFEEVRLVSGGWFENLIIFPLANIILLLILYLYWAEIRSLLLR